MIRNNKWTLIITSLVTLLPAAVGLLLWDILPDQMATHWGANGAADGMSSKSFAVFGLPCIMLAIQWLCVLMTKVANGTNGQNKKMMKVVLWLIPVISLIVNGMTYCVALDIDVDLVTIIMAMMALMFIVIGNYLPKCKRNSTMGIKLPWTLSNDTVWNKTHRTGGMLWVICGCVLLVNIFLPIKAKVIVLLAVFAAMILIPFVYSYVIYRRMLKNGEYTEDTALTDSKFYKTGSKVSLIVVPLLLIGVAVLMFTGNVEVTCGEDSFAVNATYWDDIEVEYSEISSVDYEEEMSAGMRTYGFGSARLMLGEFENEEIGKYTRYAYTGCKSCVVLTSNDGRVLVITGKDDEATKALYDELSANING